MGRKIPTLQTPSVILSATNRLFKEIICVGRDGGEESDARRIDRGVCEITIVERNKVAAYYKIL